MQSLQSTVTLNNGVAMPIFGLGVYNSKEETTFAVSTAIRHGYRLIWYCRILRKRKRSRWRGLKTVEFHETIYLLQPNCWNDMQRESRQRESFEKSLDNLGVDAVDLYLIHCQYPAKSKKRGMCWNNYMKRDL